MQRRGAEAAEAEPAEVPARQPGPAEGVAAAAEAEGARYRGGAGRELRVRHAWTEVALGARRPARVRGRADAALPPHPQAARHCWR